MRTLKNLLGGSLLALAVLTSPTQAAEAVKPIHFGDGTVLVSSLARASR
jgi:glycine betaine/proline transport system substrate-binding protein